jgi:di/tricarboxylate transporter
MLPIQASGVPIAGLIHDATGDYHLAFLIFVAAYAASAACLLFVRNPISGPVYLRQQALIRSTQPIPETASPKVCQK